jgi:peptide chain release factor 1
MKMIYYSKSSSIDSRDNAAIMEIRAGAGGNESSLFAQELYRMYSKYAEKAGWKAKVLTSRRSELGGIREIIIEISGKNSLEKMRNESGVHRVQRIPDTEKSGRIHTSTVSVAVLPKATPLDIQIKPEEMRVDTFRASGPGGQNVNKTSSAVRITHIPSGIVVSSQEGRLQQENRELAMTILRSRLLLMKQEEESKARGDLRKQQIGSGERSEKIRTYNFPQDRVTDHRIGKNWSNIKHIMDGEIDDIVASFKNKDL